MGGGWRAGERVGALGRARSSLTPSNSREAAARLRPVSPGPTRSSATLLLGLALAACAGCRVAQAKVWNLQQVHDPDGSPRRTGRVHSDVGFLFSRFLEISSFQSQNIAALKDKEIEDPLGECLENLTELDDCNEEDLQVQGWMAECYAWLAIDCTYVLSRERCALELANLARVLEVEAPIVRAPDVRTATSEEVGAAYDALVAAAQPFFVSQGGSVRDLVAACEETGALVLDRAGALRLLRACNVMLGKKRGPELEPLYRLRRELARRSVALAIPELLEDAEGRVRGAGLWAHAALPGADMPELLRWALVDPMEGVDEREIVALRALEILGHQGLWPPGGEPPPEERDAELRPWVDLMIQILQNDDGTEIGTAACHALARITGEEPTLRAEVWAARWRARWSTPAEASAGD